MNEGEKAECRFCDHVESGPTLIEAIMRLGDHMKKKHPEKLPDDSEVQKDVVS